jgi:predicted RNA-binding protein
MSEVPQGEGGSKARNRKKKVARTPRNAQYWMIVSSLENYRKTQERGFAVQGIKTRHRRRAEMMKPGDRLLYYVTGRMVFTATCTLTAGVFEEHTHIWRAARRDEDYPWRVRIKPDAVLEDLEWLPAKELAYRLEYVRKWPPEHWTLAFQGHVHQLPQKDFKLIEDELRRLESARSVAS